MRRYFLRYDFLFQRRTSLIFAKNQTFARKKKASNDFEEKQGDKIESVLSKVNFYLISTIYIKNKLEKFGGKDLDKMMEDFLAKKEKEG